MRWMPTHRITCTRQQETPKTFEVMAFDLGCEYPGPGRYALYTQVEWEAEEPAELTMDAEGRVWFQGQAAPHGMSATVEGIWEG